MPSYTIEFRRTAEGDVIASETIDAKCLNDAVAVAKNAYVGQVARLPTNAIAGFDLLENGMVVRPWRSETAAVIS